MNDKPFKKDLPSDMHWWMSTRNTYGQVNDYLKRRAPELNFTCDDLMPKIPNTTIGFLWTNTMKEKSEEEIEELK